jgi:hypothetical protein
MVLAERVEHMINPAIAPMEIYRAYKAEVDGIIEQINLELREGNTLFELPKALPLVGTLVATRFEEAGWHVEVRRGHADTPLKLVFAPKQGTLKY